MDLNIIKKLKKISIKSIENEKYEKALATLMSAANILYQYNQVYTDDDLEEMIWSVGKRLQKNNALKITLHGIQASKKVKTILFYDGFGLDLRGLALIYLKALGALGYRIIYVCPKHVMGQLPNISKVVKEFNIVWAPINHRKGYVNWCVELNACFEKYKPEVAFFYTTPFDVSADLVFRMYEGRVRRYQLDLTDHAYWVGVRSVDFCIDSRVMGATIANKYRGIAKEKIITLDVCLTIPEEKFQGWPFEYESNTKIVFSGGALYKTLGDPERKYYKCVEHILETHKDVVFIYAGTGDSSELKKIIAKYPKRAFHVSERSDFYEMMRRSILYLNTYPMFGGLMMRYAAYAGKIPITLKHNNDADGLLFDQASRKIEYDDLEEMLNDIDRLLVDENYRMEREMLLEGSVMSAERFCSELKQLIEDCATSYSVVIDENIDTSDFRREYLERFDEKEATINAVGNRNNFVLFAEFPVVLIKYVFRKINNKLRGKNI